MTDKKVEAQPEVTGAVAYPTLSPALLTALRRCEETMSDDNSYDIDAETMKKLAAFGAVWHRGGGYYTITEIGEFLLSGKIAKPSAIEAAVREKLDLSRYINAANIDASDAPHVVIEKLQAAITLIK